MSKEEMMALEVAHTVMPNLRGTSRCVNPRCARRLYSDYVKLSCDGVGGVVLLCGECWATPINELPEATHAVAVAANLWKTFGPPMESAEFTRKP